MKKRAFSLVELLVALVIISLLMAVCVPTVTKKSSNKAPVVQNIDNVPVGAMIYWLGTNYPKNWMPVKGQDITAPEYAELRKALGGNIETLPNFNMFQSDEMSLVMIIKVRK